jgi:hypothetical protein
VILQTQLPDCWVDRLLAPCLFWSESYVTHSDQHMFDVFGLYWGLNLSSHLLCKYSTSWADRSACFTAFSEFLVKSIHEKLPCIMTYLEMSPQRHGTHTSSVVAYESCVHICRLQIEALICIAWYGQGRSLSNQYDDLRDIETSIKRAWQVVFLENTGLPLVKKK